MGGLNNRFLREGGKMSVINQSALAYADQYRSIERGLPGQSISWLRKQREQALKCFKTNGFPSPRGEEWKYTNISPIERKLFSPSAQARPKIDDVLLNQYRVKGSHHLIFADGHFVPEYSSVEALSEGAIVTNIVGALGRYPDLVEQYFGQTLNREDHGFIHFNTAYFSDGCFIHLPKNTVLEKPVQLIYINTKQEGSAILRNLIVAGPGARAEIIETYTGSEQHGYLTTSVTEVPLSENAYIDLHKLQFESEKAFHFGGVYVEQKPYSVFTHHGFSFGSLLARNEIHSNLERASECVLNGLYLASGRQHIDNHTRVHHLEPAAISRETYKGILDDKAQGVFQGRIIVHKDAQKTDSDMHNRNLLLSADAEVDSKPQLEIYADDVKCAHGVTVGQLDEESVFYLKSRRVDEPTARNMLTFAFANEMVEKLSNTNLRGVVQRKVLERFPQTGVREDWL